MENSLREAQEILVRLYETVGEFEKRNEVIRQVMAEHPRFVPATLFRRLLPQGDRSNKHIMP